MSKILISPRNFPWPNLVKSLFTPPNNCRSKPLLTVSFSQIEGAKEFINISYILGFFFNFSTSFLMSSLYIISNSFSSILCSSFSIMISLSSISSWFILILLYLVIETRSMKVLKVVLVILCLGLTLIPCARKIPTNSHLSPGLTLSTNSS